MGLKEFEFIDNSLEMLKDMTPMLLEISDDLEEYFEKILTEKEQEYISMSTRVKSESSLREKIIRNRYLVKFEDSETMMSYLPDLIGVRIECRFIEDENKVYRLLRRYFNRSDDKVYYYNKENKNILLKLSERQPCKQKNGFEIYKIDGIYKILNKNINFELQIKSLVNVFWGEIEHKIIYKNNTYLLVDGFIRDLMTTIKRNLTMIDKQLLSLYKTFHAPHTFNTKVSRKEIEKLFAKFIYDIFSQKMMSDMGFVVDFKKACETIINYSLNKLDDGDDKIGEFMISEFSLLSDLLHKEIDFDSEIEFESEPEFHDEFSQNIGNVFRGRLNTEFPWNLFFRILFEIEPCNNCEDFENFIYYIKESVIDTETRCGIKEHFGKEKGKIIIDEIYRRVQRIIEDINGVEILYKQNLEKISVITADVAFFIIENFESYEDYEDMKDEINMKLGEKLHDIFI